MRKPNPYRVLKAALNDGAVKSIRDIQLIVPITTLTQDMGLNYNTLSKRLLEPSKLTIADIEKLAKLANVKPEELFLQILAETRYQMARRV